jgi:hypothetical protein
MPLLILHFQFLIKRVRVSKKTLLVIAGGVWLTVGCFLFLFGTSLVKPAPHAFLLMLGALLVGFLKGNFILKKTAIRQASRIASLKEASLKNLYSPAYYLLLGSMIALGFCMRFLPTLARGTVDIAIGSALIVGSLHLFRFKLPALS